MSFTVFGHVAGWLGALVLLWAYFLLTKKKVSSEAAVYHFLQLLGALGLNLEALVARAWPIFVFELAWIVIAVLGMAIARRRAVAPLPSP